MNTAPHAPRIFIHTPTPGAVARARNNAVTLKKYVPDAAVLIVVNAYEAAAVLEMSQKNTDSLTLVWANTMQRLVGAYDPLRTVRLTLAAIAEMQRNGWLYVRG